MATRRKATAQTNTEQDATAASSGGKKEKLNAVEAGTTTRPKAPVSRFSGLPAGWKNVEEVLPPVTAVRTIFPSFNLLSKVGGLATGRMHTAHGETHGGKSVGVIGMVASFLLGGHAAAYIDAEHSTPVDFVAKLVEPLVGKPLKSLPFFAKRPKTYEETITDVDVFLAWMTEQRKEDPSRRCIVVVDSINKLVPKRELQTMLAELNGVSDDGAKKAPRGRGGKEGTDGINKGWGRTRAGLNQAWLDHVIPLLEDAGCALMVVAQEREGEEGMPWEQGMMEVYTLKGGAALKFDASMLLRFEKVAPIKESKDKDAATLAWKHGIRIWKSKVGSMEGRWTDTEFYMKLDGTFDMARNLFYMGKELGIIATSSTWYAFGKFRKQGEKAFVAALEKDRETMDALTDAVNGAIDTQLEEQKKKGAGDEE